MLITVPLPDRLLTYGLDSSDRSSSGKVGPCLKRRLRAGRWSPLDALRIVVSASALHRSCCSTACSSTSRFVHLRCVGRVPTLDEDLIPVIAGRRGSPPSACSGSAWSRRRSGVMALPGDGHGGRGAGGGLVTLVDGLLGASARRWRPRRFPRRPGPIRLPERSRPRRRDRSRAAGVPWFEAAARIGWGLVLLLAFVRAFTEPVSLQTSPRSACGAWPAPSRTRCWARRAVARPRPRWRGPHP